MFHGLQNKTLRLRHGTIGIQHSHYASTSCFSACMTSGVEVVLRGLGPIFLWKKLVNQVASSRRAKLNDKMPSLGKEPSGILTFLHLCDIRRLQKMGIICTPPPPNQWLDPTILPMPFYFCSFGSIPKYSEPNPINFSFLTGVWLTLARTCYFAILERTWGGVATPRAVSPLSMLELRDKNQTKVWN